MTLAIWLIATLFTLGVVLLFRALVNPDRLDRGRGEAARLLAAEEQPQPADDGPVAWIGERLLPYTPSGYLRRIQADLYWLRFVADPLWGGRSPAEILGRQALLILVMALAIYLALRTPSGLALGALLGWQLSIGGLRSRAEGIRRRVDQELPEFVQLMAAQAAGGASLEAILRRVSRGQGVMARWMAQVVRAGQGRDLVGLGAGDESELYQQALESQHPQLIGLANQLSFVKRGILAPELLRGLAQQFANHYLGAAEVRAEQLGNKLGIYTALFYFFPFIFVVLAVISIPIARSLVGY